MASRTTSLEEQPTKPSRSTQLPPTIVLGHCAIGSSSFIWKMKEGIGQRTHSSNAICGVAPGTGHADLPMFVWQSHDLRHRE
jgi:hypothetical protein